MTDITTTPIFLGRPSLPCLELPKLGIGRGISEVSSSIVQAFEMAYLAPFRATQRKPPMAFDSDLEGRDPNW